MSSYVQMHVRFDDPWLLLAAVLCVLAPASWNALARWEYASRAVSGALGDGQSAVRFFCGWMCTVTLLRDAACLKACLGQPLREFWDARSELSFMFQQLALFIVVGGVVLGYVGYDTLGFTGTFMGDYCGLPKARRVVDFPFDWFPHPQYAGWVLAYLGCALFANSPAGLVLTAWLAICLGAAGWYEANFTAAIYRWVAKGKQKVSVE